jgi:hypothetical protein
VPWFIAVGVAVGVVERLDDSSVQHTDMILNAMKIKTIRIVAMIPIKYGSESCVPATVRLSTEKRERALSLN